MFGKVHCISVGMMRVGRIVWLVLEYVTRIYAHVHPDICYYG